MARHRREFFPKVLNHRSDHYKRTQTNHREHSFAVEWERQNVRRRGWPSGRGLLQALFATQESAGRQYKFTKVISNREAMIAATVVQWLGTNVGMSFLESALKKCGYDVVRNAEWDADPEVCRVCKGKGRRGMRDKIRVCGWCGSQWRNSHGR